MTGREKMELETGNRGAERMLELLRQRMRQQPGGALTFRDYMELCLYHPELGYYMKPGSKIGRQGDFYTSSQIGSLLGETLAAYAAAWAGSLEGPVVLTEWGGGTGRLASQILQTLQTESPAVYERLQLVSVEVSPCHRSLQEEALSAHADKLRFLSETQWMEQGPWANTLLYSNELPDALPVHLVVCGAAGWTEIGVAWDEAEEKLAEVELPMGDGPLLEFIRSERLPQRPGQRFELGLDAVGWMRAAAAGLGAGSAMLTIDYGHEREELYAPHRMEGTLLCYRQHHATAEPLQHPGEQDITAHVNFSALREAGTAAGLEAGKLLTQKAFLVEHGLLGRLQAHTQTDPLSPESRRNRAIRQLLLSDGMSELFKVLIQTQKR